MGGAIAMHLAVEHADRVASLTLIATSSGESDLPAMSDKLRARFEEPPPEPDWSDRQAVVDYIVDDLRAYAGSLPFPDQELRALTGRIFDRTINIASAMTNHFLLESGDPLRPRLGEIQAPTPCRTDRGSAVPVRARRGAGGRDSRRLPRAAGRCRPRDASAPTVGRGHPGHARAHWGGASRKVRVRRGPLSRCRRVPVRAELPLLALPCGDRLCLQAVRRHRAGEARDHGRGECALVHGEDDLNDTRCGACGSLLFSVVRDGAYVHVALGSLVDAPSIRPTAHIYVGSKAPWFEISDDLPQFDELP